MQSILAVTGASVTVANLSLSAGSGKGGWILQVDGAQDFTVLDNYLTGGDTDSAMGIQVRNSSGKILGNYVTRGGCGMCVFGDDVSSPASVLVIGNRSVRNFEGGLLLSGSSDSPSGSLSAVVCGNDLSENNSFPNAQNANFFSFGIRLFLILNTGNLNRSGSVTATVCNNTITNNSAGAVVDAGFSFRTQNSIFDPRLYTGRFKLTFANNRISRNIRTPAIISFTRFTASNNPAQLDPADRAQSYKYLESAIYEITYSNGELDGYWFDHPETEPIDRRTLNNVLRINRNDISPGKYIPYFRY